MHPLYRPEVIASHQQSWLGGVQLIRPLSLTLLTACAVSVAVVVAGYLFFGEYTRKARITGVLVPDLGLIRLLPPQAATVLERHAREGQRVRRGELLFLLSVDRATLSGDTQATVQRSLASRERSLQSTARQQELLFQTQRAGLAQRLTDMRGELTHLDAETLLHRQRLVLAQQTYSRLESLRANNFVSAAQLQAKAEDLLGVRTQLQRLDRQRATQLREIGSLEAQLRELPLRAQVQQREIEREIASLAQESAENESRQRIVVRAPQDGVLTAVLAELGQSVSPAAALASLVPAQAKLQAHLFAPSSAVGFVRQQQQVLLRYQAYPYQKFGHQRGQVLQVSRTTLQVSELAGLSLSTAATEASNSGNGEPLYRITVSLDQQAVQAYGRAQPLSPGMQLDADVLLDRRRLIEWLFEPLLGIAARV